MEQLNASSFFIGRFSKIFNIDNLRNFNEIMLKIFQYQAENVSVYKNYIKFLKIDPKSIVNSEEIPFLPIRFFKSHKVISKRKVHEKIFLSSGTTQTGRSKHYVSSLKLYQNSFLKSFKINYGDIEGYTLLALLPSYQEQGDSSLIYMTNELMKRANQKSRYISKINPKTVEMIKKLEAKKVLLLGVSYALLDLAEQYEFDFSNWIVMETGGMKGNREEIEKKKLHEILSYGYGTDKIFSEYGMTELLSQSYTVKDDIFRPPPWKKVLIRDFNDPFKIKKIGRGIINIIDLANINSCCFISTEDIGEVFKDGSFKIYGRANESDIRGCNNMLLDIN